MEIATKSNRAVASAHANYAWGPFKRSSGWSTEIIQTETSEMTIIVWIMVRLNAFFSLNLDLKFERVKRMPFFEGYQDTLIKLPFGGDIKSDVTSI